MSPAGPYRGVSEQAAWRGVIVFIGVVLILVVVGIVVLFGLTHSSIERANSSVEKANQATREVAELSCRLGSFFIGQPIVQQPGQSEADFVEVVEKGIALLGSLRAVDCSHIKGATITTHQLRKTLHKLRHVEATVIAEGGGGSGPPGGGGQPGGGGNGQPPAPGHPAVSVHTCELHPRLPVCVDAQIP